MRIGAGAKHSVHTHCQHHRPIWQYMTLCVSIKEEYLMCFCSTVQRAVDVLGSSHLCITQLSAQGEGEYYSPRCTNCANRNMALNCRLFSGGTAHAMLNYTVSLSGLFMSGGLVMIPLSLNPGLLSRTTPRSVYRAKPPGFSVWCVGPHIGCHTVGPHIVCSTLDTVV